MPSASLMSVYQADRSHRRLSSFDAQVRRWGHLAVNTTCIVPGGVVESKLRRVDAVNFIERNRRIVPRGEDIILAREATVGPAALLPETPPVCMVQRVTLLRPLPNVDPTWLTFVLVSPQVRRSYAPKLVGSTVPHLNVSDIRSLPISASPHDVQKRIGRKVKMLMELCDLLEDSMSKRHALYSSYVGAATVTASLPGARGAHSLLEYPRRYIGGGLGYGEPETCHRGGFARAKRCRYLVVSRL